MIKRANRRGTHGTNTRLHYSREHNDGGQQAEAGEGKKVAATRVIGLRASLRASDGGLGQLRLIADDVEGIRAPSRPEPAGNM